MGLLLLTTTISCGDDSKAAPDTGTPGPDAFDYEGLYDFDEGGESRLEYQEIFTPAGTNKRARGTAYFWKTKTPGKYPFVNIPGCTKMDKFDHFPLGMGTSHEYLDVGTVTYTGGGSPFDLPLGPVPGKDGLFRPQDGHWRFSQADMKGPMFTANYDALYDIAFGGSAEWPAQTNVGAHYMPATWNIVSPGFGPVTLPADQDLTVTWTNPNPNSKHPPGTTFNTITAFLVPPIGLIVECVKEGVDEGQAQGTFTVPKDMINYVRSFGSAGLLARAHVSHIVHELTDGTTHQHKRWDAFTIWCYVTPWTAP